MKRALTLFVLLLSLVSLFAGGTSEANSSSSEEPVTIEFWYENASPTRTPYIEEIIRRFEAENPDIKVHLVGLSNSEAKSKYDVAVASGETPDVGGMQCQWVSGYILNGAIYPLDEFLDSWDEYDDQNEMIIESIRKMDSQNRLFELSYTYNYNPLYWARADWYSEAPATWDEFFDDIESMTDEKAGTYGFSIRGGSGGPDWLLELLYAYSGIDYPFTEDGKSTINDEKHVEILKKLVDLYGRCTPQSDITNGYKEMVAAFDSGTVGCIQHNLGSYAEHSQALEPNQFFAFVSPLAENGKRVANFASNAGGVCMFSNSEHKEEAFRFMSFMCSAESQSYFNEHIGQLPPSKTASQAEWIKDRQHLSVVLEAIDGGDTIPFQQPYFLPDYTAINNSIGEPGFQAVLAGTKTVEDFLDEWADAMTAAYAEYTEYVLK